MLERFKTALVDSYVVAIALGWLFAMGITRFVGIFIEPITVWMTRRQSWSIYSSNSPSPALPFQLVFSQLLTSAAYLLIVDGLLRWLYYPVAKKQDQGEAVEPEEGV
jgi:hypothetical protein